MDTFVGNQINQDKHKELAVELAKKIRAEQCLGTLNQQLIKLWSPALSRLRGVGLQFSKSLFCKIELMRQHILVP